MAVEAGAREPEDEDPAKTPTQNGGRGTASGPKSPNSADEDESEDEEEEEPRLKYAPLTRNLSSLYRNGDASSAFVVGGDKMVCLAAWCLWCIAHGRMCLS